MPLSGKEKTDSNGIYNHGNRNLKALDMVREAYNEGSIVLDSGDYYNTVEFKDETKKYPKRERGKLPTLDKYTK